MKLAELSPKEFFKSIIMGVCPLQFKADSPPFFEGALIPCLWLGILHQLSAGHE